jgi:hypothetical protein
VLVLDGAGGVAVSAEHAAEVARDLAQEGDAVIAHGIAELGGDPVRSWVSRSGIRAATGAVKGRPAPAGNEGIAAAVVEVVEDL